MNKKVKALLVVIAIAVAAAVFTPPAGAHYYAGCKGNTCKRHVIKPYVGMFAAIGRCESGNRNWAHNPGGQYHGRYQFDLKSWRGAGGYGDPHNFGYLEQTYRAVIWLHRNGRQSWPNC